MHVLLQDFCFNGLQTTACDTLCHLLILVRSLQQLSHTVKKVFPFLSVYYFSF